MAELTGIADQLRDADLVFTGEGSLDQQSLAGKAPTGVAAMARDLGVPVVALAGWIALSRAQLAGAGIDAARALVDHAPSPEYAQRHARDLLRTQSAALVRAYAATRGGRADGGRA